MDKLSKIIGKGKTTVKHYEDGSTLPDSQVIQRLVSHFEVSYYELFEVDLSEVTKNESETASVDYNTLDKSELVVLCQSKDDEINTLQSKLDLIKSDIGKFIDSKLS